MFNVNPFSLFFVSTFPLSNFKSFTLDIFLCLDWSNSLRFNDEDIK